MTGKSRAERAAALEEFADNVEPQDLTTADTESLRAIAELAELNAASLDPASWDRDLAPVIAAIQQIAGRS